MWRRSNTAVRWAYTEQGAPFTSGTDGEGAFLASAGDEFTTAANRRPEIVVHSVEGDMTTQTVSVTANRRAGAWRSGDKDIVLRRYDRSYDGGGEQPAVVVMTESCDGEDNDQQDDYKPSAMVDPGARFTPSGRSGRTARRQGRLLRVSAFIRDGTAERSPRRRGFSPYRRTALTYVQDLHSGRRRECVDERK